MLAFAASVEGPGSSRRRRHHPSACPSARLIRRWLEGDFDLIVSQRLLAELKRALACPKLRARVSEAASDEFIWSCSGDGHHATRSTEPAATGARPR
jgi:hypothetical protein